MGCFHQTLVQVWIWFFLTKDNQDGRQNGRRLSVCIHPHCCGHSNLVIFNQISSKFHIWFASIKPWFKFEYEFCPTNDNKMADKMATVYQFASIRCCCHSNFVIFNQISSKFHIWFASIKPWFKFEYELCRTNYNQDGWQNGLRLSVCVRPLLWSL